MWFIITFFIIYAILQLANIVGFFISLIETIFKIEIIKENSWMERILAKHILTPLAIIFLVMFALIMVWRIMCFILGCEC